MQAPIDDATAQFLEAVVDDLQRQLNQAGTVDRISTHPWPGGAMLVAHIRIGHRTAEVKGFGDSLVTAHTDLRRQLTVSTLVAAFSELVEAPVRDRG